MSVVEAKTRTPAVGLQDHVLNHYVNQEPKPERTRCEDEGIISLTSSGSTWRFQIIWRFCCTREFHEGDIKVSQLESMDKKENQRLK